EAIGYGRLFRAGSSERRIDQLIREAVRRQKIPSDPPARRAYDFYLTPRALMILNLFNSPALGSFEAQIPLARLSQLSDPEGPLGRLSGAAALDSSRYVKLTGDEQERWVRPALGRSETVAHQVVKGPFGPSSESIVVVTEKDGKFGGFVLVPD